MVAPAPTIRLAAPTDIPAITDLLNHEIEHGYAHFGTEPIAQSEAHAQFQRDHDRFAWLVARSDGEFTGFAKAGAWKARGAYAWSAEVSIYLTPGSRGLGFGRMLYDRLFAIIRAQGFRVIMAGASMPNEASDRLHKGMGMRVVGDLTRIGFKHGRWIDVRWYQLDIGDASAPAAPPLGIGETIRILDHQCPSGAGD